MPPRYTVWSDKKQADNPNRLHAVSETLKCREKRNAVHATASFPSSNALLLREQAAEL